MQVVDPLLPYFREIKKHKPQLCVILFVTHIEHEKELK